MNNKRMVRIRFPKRSSRSGNRTPGASVTGSNVTNYTNREIGCNTFWGKHSQRLLVDEKKFPDRELNPGLSGESRVS